MNIRRAGPLSGLVVSALILSGCVQPTAQNNPTADMTTEIVTPWGTTVAASSSPGSMSAAGANAANGKFVVASDPKMTTITEMQRQQIDEARIALDILDRMAQRCVQDNDPAACNTLQTNWPTLSQQLRKSLSIISGDSMGRMPSAGTPIMSDPTARATPGLVTSPAPAPTTMPQNGAPTMEKTIPMMSNPVDG
ncbi:hypothetical protein L6172_06885 [Thalassospiraceae bacterium SW-3-3]|nr:hypothetical protein L6172_06885 [Thalassospiraceae bacterium SW-3-3]